MMSTTMMTMIPFTPCGVLPPTTFECVPWKNASRRPARIPNRPLLCAWHSSTTKVSVGAAVGHHGPLKFVPISAMLRAVPTFWNVRMLFPRAPTIFEPKKTATPSVLGTGAADTSSVATAKTLRTSALPAFPSLDAAPTSLSGPSDQPRRSVPPAARRPRVTIEENQRKEKRRKLVVTHTARVNKNMELKSTHIGLAEIYRFKQKEIDIAHEIFTHFISR
mmetsp:Transcript_5462/g.11267  ORF Transcript_5462/g.11267 Transcript_5462/m.11267 type:complete len:220 (-) Transcript_5462:287-946(-)